MALLDVWAADTWAADSWVDSSWGAAAPSPGVTLDGWAANAWAAGSWANGTWGAAATPVTPTPPLIIKVPIPERIARELVLRLEGITEGAGYTFTTPSVYRVSHDGREWTPKHNSIVVVQQDQERLPEHDCPGNPPSVAYQLPFRITGFIRKPEFQEYADWSDINEMEAAIKAAVVGGDIGWRNFDGYSYNANWGSVEYDRSTSHTTVTVVLEVMYRVSEDDPFTVR